MEDAVNQCSLHERNHSGSNDIFGVNAGVLHSGDIIKIETIDSLHDERPSRHQLRVRARNDISSLTKIVEHLGNINHVRRFETEVEFFNNGLCEQLDESGRVRKCSNRNSTDEVWGKPRHHLEIGTNEASNVRSLHLDYDFGAIEQGCPVDLGD